MSEAVQLKLKSLVQEIGEQKEVICKIELLENSTNILSLRNEKYILNLAKQVYKSKYGVTATFVEQHSALLLGSASPDALCSAAQMLMTAPDGKHLKAEKSRKMFGQNLKFWGRVRRNSFQLMVNSLSLVDPKLHLIEGSEM